MQPDRILPTVSEQVTDLNRQVDNLTPIAVLEFALQHAQLGQTALVSSFGAEAIALLHMVSRIDPSLPVLFLDTQLLFKQTLAYQIEVSRQLKLSNVRRIRPNTAEVSAQDPNGTLHLRDKDACCALRKNRPLQQALQGFDTWVTGRKRFQSKGRASLAVFEGDGEGRIKVNPLAHWQPEDVRAYLAAHRLPHHPLLAHGFASIGCAPCTSAVKTGEDARAGRWRGSEKTECGIHFSNGKVQHPPSGEGLSS